MIGHIQINDVTPRIHYDADGVQLAFTYPFAIFKASDLEVWLGEVRQDGAFTVSGTGISSGGSVLFAVAPPAGTRVTLRRRLTLERVSDYQADGIIRAKTLNDELDYQVAALQQVAEDVGRALKLAPTSPSSAELTLPEPAAGRGLKWNASGSALVNSDHDPDALGNVAQALADAQAAAEEAGAARDQAIAAAGGVKVSANDGTLMPLGAKVVAGTGITVTEQGDGADERLVIAATMAVPPSITERLAFLEQNLAVTVLRDQIDSGWSVLKMVDGVADEFEDETGIATKIGATYDDAGDFYSNPGTDTRIVGGTPTMPAGGVAANINDNSISTSATTTTLFNGGGIVVAEIDYGAAKSLTKIEADLKFNIGSAPKYLQFYYWNGSSWVAAGSSISPTNTAGLYAVTGAWSGSKIRIATLAGGNDWSGETLTIRYFNGYQPGFVANMSLVSVANPAETFTMAAPPVESRLVVLHQPVAALALNTDLIAEISRNGGADWTAATLTDEGGFDSFTRVLAVTADLSAQPAGTSMVWRLRTLNNKEQRLHGVWLQWR